MGDIREPDHEPGSRRALDINAYSLLFGQGDVAINQPQEPNYRPFDKNISRGDPEVFLLLIGGIKIFIVGDFLIHDSDDKVAGVNACDTDDEFAGLLFINMPETVHYKRIILKWYSLLIIIFGGRLVLEKNIS